MGQRERSSGRYRDDTRGSATRAAAIDGGRNAVCGRVHARLSVLMRSNPYRNLPLTQIQGLVVPAIMTGQFAIMDAEVNGQLTPIAVAFWAHVSTEVDQRLSDTSIAVPKLGPNDWKSGDIPWLLDVVGHPQAAQQLITQLNAGPFAGRDVRVRRRTVDGLMTVERLLDLDIGTSNGTGSAFDQQ